MGGYHGCKTPSYLIIIFIEILACLFICHVHHFFLFFIFLFFYLFIYIFFDLAHNGNG